MDNSDNNVLETYGSFDGWRTIVRRGFRASEYVATYKFKWASDCKPGFLIRWVDPGNWLRIQLRSSDGKAQLGRRKDDGQITAVATSTSSVTLTPGSWYNAKVVVDKPDTSQRLRFWVDEDGDGFDAGDLLLTSTAVDDDWLGGYVGLFKGAGMTTVHQFDDFKVGFDDDSDDTLDADEVVLHDDFNSAAITLTHDNNGNLTYDGVYEYVYDFLNRLVKVKYAEPSGGADLAVAEYEYDGMNRRIRKHVQNFGEGVVPGSDEGGTITGIQAGNRHEHYYYAGWRVIEERNNSDDVLAQTVWSTEYIDAPVCRDRNTDVGEDNEDYSSCIDAGSRRYFYHQGPNYRVWALTDESGDVVERYDYDAYGEPRLYAGHDSSVSAELGNALFVSSAGNPYMHQGLRRDDETGLHENRMRAYHSRLGRFIQRDRAGYVDSMNLYECLRGSPLQCTDPAGAQAMLRGTPYEVWKPGFFGAQYWGTFDFLIADVFIHSWNPLGKRPRYRRVTWEDLVGSRVKGPSNLIGRRCMVNWECWQVCKDGTVRRHDTGISTYGTVVGDKLRGVKCSAPEPSYDCPDLCPEDKEKEEEDGAGGKRGKTGKRKTRDGECRHRHLPPPPKNPGEDWRVWVGPVF